MQEHGSAATGVVIGAVVDVTENCGYNAPFVIVSRRDVLSVAMIQNALSADPLPYASRLPAIVFGVYLFASVATFLIYARDKSAAREGRRRTPERTLHLLALAGGWPGALIAQKVLHHKSRKRSFQVVFWGTVFGNGTALFWLARTFF